MSKSPLPSAVETVILLPFGMEKSTGRFILTGTDACDYTDVSLARRLKRLDKVNASSYLPRGHSAVPGHHRQVNNGRVERSGVGERDFAIVVYLESPVN